MIVFLCISVIAQPTLSIGMGKYVDEHLKWIILNIYTLIGQKRAYLLTNTSAMNILVFINDSTPSLTTTVCKLIMLYFGSTLTTKPV